ncbi:MAG: RdgB/HAM1 family non-canonical purine NTP pyrophosphatase [Chloroflexi bacterium]|jgi:XTP/dITP diphosphohydrolase|nr:MAG: HAM1 protein [Chloroflexi bacterium OLB13]MBC6956648.1 RdgB/HAM1 family non-canonical purine NTP pyrophosphatase [Chloroflexota bacterium]MBV6436952.1 dITP/XTP pyrophosphatase [Anaerolineae bacterium]MDL1915767.1 RdgB/HAM1 family non-canonical purine NTP pyrophosphatase [Anaerolineae bacterium CFX4]OQY82733.1 MAG: non-canonical purine NTP pyrophosphatase, RdgB/HAM1 family [Anaerolineae bacterium UTCFX5]
MAAPISLLLATRNRGKLGELQQLLDGLPVRLLTADDVGLSHLDVAETGDTLLENASLKAAAYGAASGLPTIADDTGLFVDALNGRPGVRTARFGGPLKLLDALRDIPAPRRAHFACVIALRLPDGSQQHVTGTCPGQIMFDMRGAGGFGYDPVFQPDGYDQTFAELGEAIKNPISHRGLAVAALAPLLKSALGIG